MYVLHLSWSQILYEIPKGKYGNIAVIAPKKWKKNHHINNRNYLRERERYIFDCNIRINLGPYLYKKLTMLSSFLGHPQIYGPGNGAENEQ